MLNSKKKTHFKFKQKVSCKKHISSLGFYGFKLKNSVCIDSKYFDLLKFLILKKIKKNQNTKIKLLFCSKYNYNKTKLPMESRMGKGKGEIQSSFGYYKSGFLLFKLRNSNLNDVLILKNYLNKKTSLNFSLIF